MPSKKLSRNTLKFLVGPEIYAVWVKMLSALAPDSRSHRLGVVIASMLQYAAEAAYRRFRDSPPEGSLAEALLYASENAEPMDRGDSLISALKDLLKDAKVKDQRISVQGEWYSLIDYALAEFIHWGDMPWE